jgi:hypothetical protein
VPVYVLLLLDLPGLIDRPDRQATPAGGMIQARRGELADHPHRWHRREGVPDGTGHLTSVDSTRWQWLNPAPREVLEKAGLSNWVTLDKRFSTYTWFLKTEIEKRL